MKYLAVVAIIVLAITVVAPIAYVNAGHPVETAIQYRFFATQDQLFNALKTDDLLGGIDIMDWPLTNAEYNQIINNATLNASIQVCPNDDGSEFELAFNNNWTDGIQMDRRSPMNFTDFRNALNCLVDKNGVINGPVIAGFATRDDTQIPMPLMSSYANPAVSYPYYPWEFNVTHALQILWNGNWYSHTQYPVLSNLITAWINGSLAGWANTPKGVVYSGNDPNGQWGGGDPLATVNSGLANTPLAPLIGYVRSDTGTLKDLGDMFCSELQAIGCPFVENNMFGPDALRPFVIEAQLYDFATLSYIFTAPPDWFYEECTPLGIYPGGPNPYLIDDANMTYYATAMYTAGTPAFYQANCSDVQDILVMESYLVSAYSDPSFNAYKTGMLGMVDNMGYSFFGQVHSQLLEWMFLNCRKTGLSDPNTIYYGELNPPDMVNPLFSRNVFDSEVEDQIFTYAMSINPYNPLVPGSAITGTPAGSDMPWMAYSWKTELIPAQDGSGGTWTNLTIWFRNDITWHDGVPFTVYDVNYTIWANALYHDAYANAIARCCADASNNYAPYFTAWNNYACSILVTNPSWLNLQRICRGLEIIPEHLYKYIVPLNISAAKAGTAKDGLHGLWPGQSPTNTASNVLPNTYFTLPQLQSKPETTLVGTGPWQYRIGSLMFGAGGGIILDAYTNFPITFVGHNHEIAAGEIDFRYTWLNTLQIAQPSGGYWKVGLGDLVLLANAYGTVGTPSKVPWYPFPGALHTWNPAADMAAPSCVIGLSDLVTLATHYGWYWGNYSYNAPYPIFEINNGGP